MSRNFRQAHYTEQRIPEYKGNPFIEALHPIRSSNELLDILKHYPEVPKDCSTWLTEERIQGVWTALSLFQPLSMHIDIAQTVDRMIRLGLVPRNLPSKDAYFWQGVKEITGIVEQGLEFLPSPMTTSTSVIGASGMGKTTAISRILAQYPAVIEHPVSRVEDAGRIQLTWLYLNCTSTGSIGALCEHFFQQVDKLFGMDSTSRESHYWKYARGARKIDTLMGNVAHAVAKYRLGVLVIDELQFLSTAGVGMERAMNYLTRLSNVAKVPIVYLGTYKVLPILMKEFRQARRSAGQGDFLWHPMQRDGEWEHFVKVLWHYQYLEHKTELTPALSKTLYDESQGITDYVVKLFLLAQVRAIMTGKEKLSVSLIKQVSKDSIRLVAPFLKKLKDKLKAPDNIEQLAQIDDLDPLDFKEFFERETSARASLPTPGNDTPRPSQETPGQPSPATEQPTEASKAVASENNTSDADALDLRKILAQAKKDGRSCESVMLERSVIKSATEFLYK